MGYAVLEEHEELTAIREVLEKENDHRSHLLISNISDNPVCTITIDNTIPCVAVTWKRYVTDTQLRFVHEAILHQLRANGLNKVLGDDTMLQMINEECQAWIIHNWLPRAKKAGFRAGAGKSPVSFFCKLAIKKIIGNIPPDMPVRSFEDINEARTWLKSVR